VHKARSIQKWFVEIGVEELDWTEPWPQPHRKPLGWIGTPTTSKWPNLTNALVAEWKQVPAAMFQHLVESLPRRVEAIIAANGGPTPY
jgi:hypothetical protein